MTSPGDLREWALTALVSLFDRVPDQLPPLPPRPAPEGALGAAADRLRRAFAAAPRGRIESDHVRLFVNAPGGIPAPPYESFYADGHLLGPSTAAVEALYADYELALAPDAGQPADFIAIELEFLLFLGRHARAAVATSDAAALEATCAAQHRFVREHLGRWVPSFAAATRAGRPGTVFGAAVDLLETLLCDVETAASMPFVARDFAP